MYTRIALGKNSAMDVVSGESSGGQGQLLILYPLLFALQILEIWIGMQPPPPPPPPGLMSCISRISRQVTTFDKLLMCVCDNATIVAQTLLYRDRIYHVTCVCKAAIAIHPITGYYA